MTDAVLPSLGIAFALLSVLTEPLVNVLEGHGLVGGAHEGLVNQLRKSWPPLVF